MATGKTAMITCSSASGFNVGLHVGKNSNLSGNDFFNNEPAI
jgi:hypothetical protein